MTNEFRTVRNRAEARFEEKKSIFIATVLPVTEEAEITAFLAELRGKYWDATHNVYAYLVQSGQLMQKFSDDGEPSGTAGLPTLEAIRRAGVQDLCVVVTRYFGGTLLGAAGLVRAYGKSASLGIEAAGIITRRRVIRMTVTLEYTLLGKVQHRLQQDGCVVERIDYGQDADIHVFVPMGAQDAFCAMIVEETCDQALTETGEVLWITVEDYPQLRFGM